MDNEAILQQVKGGAITANEALELVRVEYEGTDKSVPVDLIADLMQLGLETPEAGDEPVIGGEVDMGGADVNGDTVLESGVPLEDMVDEEYVDSALEATVTEEEVGLVNSEEVDISAINDNPVVV